MAMAVALLILVFAAPAAVYGAEHTIGGDQGWTQGVDYATWASGQTFTVGDTLVFNYDGSHKVDEVSQADYTACGSGNSAISHGDSPTKITLSKAGPTYYICPVLGHCANGGMKLLVNAVAAGTPSTTPSTPSPPPATPATTPAPPTTTTPSNNDSPPPPPPPPKIPSPASSLNMNLVGVPLVLATLIAVMG